jgi:outer membrane protein
MNARLAVVFGLMAAALARSAMAADDAPLSNEVRLGAYWITYHVHADDISGPFVPPGVNIRLKDVYTPYFAYVRRLNDRFSVELAMGWPPLTKTVGKGPAQLGSVPYDGQVITTARWLAPTLLLNWFVLPESYKLRPYIGLGVNYTRFYDRNSTPAGNAATGGPTSISLPASVGPAGTVGLSYTISRHFHVYASYSLSQVSSRLTANTAGNIRTSHVEFGPRATVVSAGYSF